MEEKSPPVQVAEGSQRQEKSEQPSHGVPDAATKCNLHKGTSLTPSMPLCKVQVVAA